MSRACANPRFERRLAWLGAGHQYGRTRIVRTRHRSRDRTRERLGDGVIAWGERIRSLSGRGESDFLDLSRAHVNVLWVVIWLACISV